MSGGGPYSAHDMTANTYALRSAGAGNGYRHASFVS